MTKKTFSYLFVYITYISQSLGSEFKCSLLPLEYGLYYGTNQLTFDEAIECCEYPLKIVNLGMTGHIRNGNGSETSEKEIWEVVHEVLLTFPSSDPPIGGSNGIWVQLDDDSNSTNEDSTACYEVHFRSPRNLTLEVQEVSCTATRRYLCGTTSSSPFYETDCDAIEMELLNGRYYIATQRMSWKDAVDCCERKGLHLSEFLPTNALVGKNMIKDLKFWVASQRDIEGSSLWKRYHHSYFQSNYEDHEEFIKVQDIPSQSQSRELGNCGIVYANKANDGFVIEPFACQHKADFICKSEASEETVDICTKVNFQNVALPKGMRDYWYSGDMRLNWTVAQTCCHKKGWALFTLISPEEGQHIAGSLQRNPDFRNRHKGFDYGLWTSGKRGQNNNFVFVGTHSKVSFPENGNSSSFPILNQTYNYFIPTLEHLSADICLQFVVDTRNSYFLNDVSCSEERSFICQSPVGIEDVGGELHELGNKYFYSAYAVSAAAAEDLCFFNKMTLVQLKFPEEDLALARVIKNLVESHFSSEHGIWTNGPHKVIDLGGSKEHELHKPKQEQLHYPEVLIENSTECHVLFYSLRTGQLNRSKVNCRSLHRVICERKIGFDDSLNAPEACSKDALIEIGEGDFLSKIWANWTEARRCCSSLDLELVSVLNNTKALYNALAKLDTFFGPNLGAWTSGRSSILSQQFMWVDSATFLSNSTPFYHQYTNQSERVVIGQKLCLEAIAEPNHKHQQLTLSEDDCVKSKRFLCGPKSKTNYKVDCDSIHFVQIGQVHSSYFLSTSPAPFLRAAECCTQRGGNLAPVYNKQVSSEFYSDIVKRLGWVFETAATGFWVGLTTELYNRAGYHWVGTGIQLKTTDYQPWSADHVHSSTASFRHGCVAAFTRRDEKELTWEVLNCTSLPLHFMCKRQ